MKKLLLLTLVFLFPLFSLLASPIKKIQPAFWWTRMKNTKLQILIYGDKIADWNISLNYPGVSVSEIIHTTNPNYAFLYVDISAITQPGQMNIEFMKGKEKFSQPYELKSRQRDSMQVKGFDERDLMYLVFPDRFSNGDVTDDSIAGMNETKVDRSDPKARHGGDLQGVINHLDYIKDLGVTTIWLNPVLENNEPTTSYHGYAITDFYVVDPRLGNNDLYAKMVAEAHNSGLKVVMDYVYNHVGTECWFVKDLPSPDWLNQWPDFTRCNYRPASLADPYGSQYDRNLNVRGWFDKHMADLNQQNRLLADYLIQSTIWWVEFAGVDGFRVDTYPYPDNDFMNECLKRLYDEYPHINVVGETWEQTIADVAYWQKNSPVRNDGKQNELVSITDFNLFFALKDGLKEQFGWTTGLRKIYYTLAQDFLYSDPYKNMIFLDNHDVNRIYSELGEDYSKWKQAIAILLTTRGIPCLYYGTEILMSGLTNPTDGLVRKDFPGGWANDSSNKFISSGRTEKENEAFDYVKKLANFRETNSVMQTGKLMQFIPDDDVYVYFRYDDKNCVMIAINTSDQLKKLDPKRYAERLNGYSSGINVIDGSACSNLDDLSVQPHGVMICSMK